MLPIRDQEETSLNNKILKMIRGTVRIQEELCKGCELCIIACPQDSLGLSPHINQNGYRFAELIQDNCTGCVNCAIVCPEAIITVYRQTKQSLKKAV